MTILRIALSVLKTLMLLGLLETVVPHLGYELGVLIGELIGEGISSGTK